MIQTTNLTRKYGDLIALDNLNLQIDEGEEKPQRLKFFPRC